MGDGRLDSVTDRTTLAEHGLRAGLWLGQAAQARAKGGTGAIRALSIAGAAGGTTRRMAWSLARAAEGTEAVRAGAGAVAAGGFATSGGGRRLALRKAPRKSGLGRGGRCGRPCYGRGRSEARAAEGTEAIRAGPGRSLREALVIAGLGRRLALRAVFSRTSSTRGCRCGCAVAGRDPTLAGAEGEALTQAGAVSSVFAKGGGWWGSWALAGTEGEALTQAGRGLERFRQGLGAWRKLGAGRG